MILIFKFMTSVGDGQCDYSPRAQETSLRHRNQVYNCGFVRIRGKIKLMQKKSTILHTSVIQKLPFDWTHNISTSSAFVSRSDRRR